MALLESISITLGTKMPDFNLKDSFENDFSSSDLLGENGLLVAFTCNHCPYAIAIWDRLISLSLVARSKGINTVAINPNINPDYPEDSPEKMSEKVSEWDIPFPYLVDADQSVAKSFNAQCTPDLYLLNSKGELAYHGRLDDNWKDPDQVSKRDLEEAINALGENSAISGQQYPSMGCSIKWQ